MPFDPKIPFVPSPNFSERHWDRWQEVGGVVVHYTAGGSANGSIRWLCNPHARASAHFVISRSGRVPQLVELSMKAWHAGVAEMPVEGEATSDPSRFTIGIELANHGLLQQRKGEFFYEVGRQLKPYQHRQPRFSQLVYDSGLTVGGYWEPYPDAQLDALQELLLKLAGNGYRQAASNLIGHEEISMPLGRKRDPGPLFPWERFSRKLERRTQAASVAI